MGRFLLFLIKRIFLVKWSKKFNAFLMQTERELHKLTQDIFRIG